MRDVHIEQLLGGYATNSLSDEERQTLFEAALNDQDLFNALQDEEAFRDLLADAESRQSIVRALLQPARIPEKRWWARGWIWAAVASAACASALIFGVLASRPAYVVAPNNALLKGPNPEQIAAPQGAAPQDRAMDQRRKAARRMPAVPAPQTKPIQINQAPSMERAADAQPAPSPTPEQQRVSTTDFRASGAYMNLKTETLAPTVNAIPYTLLKRAADGRFTPLLPGQVLEFGDSVRLLVRPLASGFLNLSGQNPGREPFNINVSANREYTIPDSPIQVGGEQQLRLVLRPTVTPASTGVSGEAKRTVPIDKLQPAQRTFVTNITIAPGRASLGR